MPPNTQLNVRREDRSALQLNVEFVVTEVHREQVHFSTASTASLPHTAAGQSIDISPGGLGLVSEQFVPRMTEGTLRIFEPLPINPSSADAPTYKVAFEHPARVRRIVMNSSRPTYQVGLAFVDPEPNIQQRIGDLLERVANVNDAAHGETGGTHA